MGKRRHAQPDGEERRDGDLRDGLRKNQQRVEGLFRKAPRGDHQGEGHAHRDRH